MHNRSPTLTLKKAAVNSRILLSGILITQFVILLALSYISWQRTPDGTFTSNLYYDYSLKFLQGQIPYRDFEFEYPPLALLTMLPPHFVKFGQLVSESEYFILFMFENVLLSIFGGFLLVWTNLRWQSSKNTVISLAVYSVLIIITAPIMLGRYDLFPALLTMLAVISAAGQKAALAGVWLAIGIAVKLYPIILIPVLGLYYLVESRYNKLFDFGVGLLLGIFASLCFVWQGISHLSSFLSYHQTRGIQLESIPSGIIALSHILDLTNASIVSNFGAKHIVSPWADNTLRWLTLFSILSFCGLILFCRIVFKREQASAHRVSFKSLITFVLLMLLTFIATGKVFSPQYVIWLLPFIPFLTFQKAVLNIAIALMTVAIYPFLYDKLLVFDVWAVILLNLRNGLVVSLLFWLVIERFNVPFTPNSSS